jgi:nitrite reductase (NADH) large subunit
MKACGASSRSGVVVGGGLLGLECAKALRDLGWKPMWSSSRRG